MRHTYVYANVYVASKCLYGMQMCMQYVNEYAYEYAVCMCMWHANVYVACVCGMLMCILYVYAVC